MKVIEEKAFLDKGVVKVKSLKIAPDPGTSHILPLRNHPIISENRLSYSLLEVATSVQQMASTTVWV